VPELTVDRLSGGALVLRSELWATNSAIVPAGDACLVCDPSIFPDEIAQILAATEGYERAHLFITHSDFDHVCGIPAFSDATVVTGAATAAAITDGTARRKLDDGGREWGTAWDGELRVDLVAGGDPVRCGDQEMVAIDARGHIDDGSAFLASPAGLLFVGDYLSAVCQPIVLGSVDTTIRTIERLHHVIAEHDVATVVPGHGPVLDRSQAERIAGEDARYLRALQLAAAAAVRDGAGAEAALRMVRAVPAPRAARPDFEAFDWLSANARQALTEAGHGAFSGVQAAVTPAVPR
jgi:hydroxyacylglutathione hydrolase